MKFKIDVIIDISSEKPGLLIPIFKIEGSNLPYAQEMNDAYEVYDMKPYLESDYYPYVIPEVSAFTDIGERGVICLRSYDGRIICGNIGEIVEHYNDERENIAVFPTLDMQLARLCGDPLAVLMDKWAAVERNSFKKPVRGDWTDGELRVYQKSRSIWDRINAKDGPDRDHFLDTLNQHSFEFLFRWLVKHPTSDHWAVVWLRAIRLSPFDERMPMIAKDWLIGKILSYDDFNDFRIVLFLYLESDASENDTDFSDALTEYIIEDAERFHQFLHPPRLPLLILQKLDAETEPAGALRFVGYLIERLEGDERYTNTTDFARNFSKAIHVYIEQQRSDDEFTKKHSTTILREWKKEYKKRRRDGRL
ncbi:MAG: hypothetical protein PGN20_08950 [Agrobacterium cavarae]